MSSLIVSIQIKVTNNWIGWLSLSYVLLCETFCTNPIDQPFKMTKIAFGMTVCFVYLFVRHIINKNCTIISTRFCYISHASLRLILCMDPNYEKTVRIIFLSLKRFIFKFYWKLAIAHKKNNFWKKISAFYDIFNHDAVGTKTHYPNFPFEKKQYINEMGLIFTVSETR